MGASEFVLLRHCSRQERQGGDDGRLVWSDTFGLNSWLLAYWLCAPGQSFNFSEPLFLYRQNRTKTTAQGGWPLKHGSLERGHEVVGREQARV